MAIPVDYVLQVFKGPESGGGEEFFAHVADHVDWIMEGTHPLAGHYHSKVRSCVSSTLLSVMTGPWLNCIH
jgi:hypothetical protein